MPSVNSFTSLFEKKPAASASTSAVAGDAMTDVQTTQPGAAPAAGEVQVGGVEDPSTHGLTIIPWEDEALPLESRADAFQQWKVGRDEAWGLFKLIPEPERPVCLQCAKAHPAPCIPRDINKRAHKAGHAVLEALAAQKAQQEQAQGSAADSEMLDDDETINRPKDSQGLSEVQKGKQKASCPVPPVEKGESSRTKNNSKTKAKESKDKTQSQGEVPVCHHCARKHWLGKKGNINCRAPNCRRCNRRHFSTETCVAAKERFEKAGLIASQASSGSGDFQQEALSIFLPALVNDSELTREEQVGMARSFMRIIADENRRMAGPESVPALPARRPSPAPAPPAPAPRAPRAPPAPFALPIRKRKLEHEDEGESGESSYQSSKKRKR